MQIYRQFLTPQNYFLVFLKKITEADKEKEEVRVVTAPTQKWRFSG